MDKTRRPKDHPRSFRATLTATTNKYLVDRLPVEGFLEIIEINLLGGISQAVFMPDPEPGKGTSFVSVPNAEFTLTGVSRRSEPSTTITRLES